MNPRIILALAHILVILPFLFYIGFSRAGLPQGIYNFLIILGALIAIYHLMRLINKNKLGLSSTMWINAIHLLFIAPLLIYIGINKRDTPRAAYELLLILAFGGFGYHLYNLILETQVHMD